MTTNDPLTAIRTRNPRTAQTVRDNPTQVQNLAGGFVFGVDDLTRLDRFLIMGSEGSYYASAKKMTVDNAEALMRMVDSDPALVVRRILDISVNGRAAKQDYAIFALAVVAGLANHEGKVAAFTALPRVARTASTLFMFSKYLTQFRSWSGRMAKTAGRAWYTNRPADRLAYQMLKYRARNGYSQQDMIRILHPKAPTPQHDALFRWAAKGEVGEHLPTQFQGFLELQKADGDEQRAADLIREHNLPWEAVPDSLMNSVPVWEALLDANMGTTALIRMLSRLTNLGMLGKGKGTRVNQVVEQLTDPETLRAARIHPMNVLVALKTYAQGHSVDGKGRWTPERKIVDALDEAFYASFKTIEPTGKRILIAVDCSGSMGYESISGMPLVAREAAAAVALSVAKVEKNYDIVGFTAARGHRSYATWRDIRDSNGLTELTLSPRQRMDDALRVLDRADFGATDCALPFTWALGKRAFYDAVLVLTDNETWAGPIKVDQALRDYRAQINPQARFMALAFTATGYSVADENDALSLNISGLDTAVPTLVTNFIRGEF